MGHTITITIAALGAVACMVFDGVWLGPRPSSSTSCSGPALRSFVIPRASIVSWAAIYGAMFGLVLCGVYDFTYDSTLRQWPLVLTLAGGAWGAAASAAAAAIVRTVVR